MDMLAGMDWPGESSCPHPDSLPPPWESICPKSDAPINVFAFSASKAALPASVKLPNERHRPEGAPFFGLVESPGVQGEAPSGCD